MHKAKVAAHLALCLLLMASLTVPLTLTASAAVNLFVRDLSIGSLSNKGTHYEMTVPAGATQATFSVQLTGADYASALMMRTFLVDSATHPVASVTPEKVQITGETPVTVTMRFAGNTAGAAQTGDIELSFMYEATNTPLGNVVVRVNRPSGSAAELAQESVDLPESAAAVRSALESATVMPQIEIDGNAATMTYKNPALVSWSGPEPDMTLTLSNISVLEKDTPVQVPGPPIDGVTQGYTVTLPAEQINAVLAAKADDIARNVLTGTEYKEDALDGEMLVLVPVDDIEPQPFTTLDPLDERFSPTDDGFALMADGVSLTDLADEILLLEIDVYYKDVAASEPAVVNVPLDNSEYFPSLHEVGGDGGIALGGAASGEDIPLQLTDAVLIGGLMQKYDPTQDNYLQWIDAKQQFRSNVPNGMITNNEVVLDYPSDMQVEVFLNGKRTEYLTGQVLTESGQYNVRVYAFVDDKEALASAGDIGEIAGLMEALKVNKLFRFDFEIINDAVSAPRYLNPPVGFYIDTVIFEGEPLDFPSDSYLELERDGAYEIFIAGEDVPEYTIFLRADSVAPTLAFAGVSNGGITYETVVLQLESDTDKITVLRDAQPYSVNRNTIDQPGVYVITVRDLAGNFTQYQFRVMYSMNISGVTSLMLSAVVVLGLGAYLYYVRTHMKVR